MSETYRNLIAGKWVEASTHTTFANTNPADTSDVIGTFAASGPADIDEAVVAAKAGFEEWSRVPAPVRGDLLRRAGDLLTERKEELADGMTREMGKPLVETQADVQEAIDTAYYAASEGRRLFGYTAPSELPQKMGVSIRRPAGVFGVITPWNFPIAVPSWKIFPALVCGDSVVWKPAEDTPWSAAGFGPEAGAPLTTHRWVTGISFTGSTAVGCKIAAACGEQAKPVSLEMGGKNAQLVLDDADVELALDGVLWGAFGTTGQRCTATGNAAPRPAVCCSRLVFTMSLSTNWFGGLKRWFSGMVAKRTQTLGR
jgi:aldehyde dehydrogenase (NAD+)